jgi:hypothetical protein
VSVSLAFVVGGCAGLVFNPTEREGALTYFETTPYFFVSTSKDCVTTASVVAVPGAKKSVSLMSGYGSADLSVSLSNGMIASVGQKTDTKIPETITAIGGLATNLGIGPKADQGCPPKATLYPIVNGHPDNTSAIPFPVAP